MEEKPLSTKVLPPFDIISTCFREMWYPGTRLLSRLLASQLMGSDETV